MAGVVCGSLDLNEISDDEKIVLDGVDGTPNTQLAWVKIDVESKLYLQNPPNSLTPVPHAIIKFSSPCYSSLCTNGLGTWRASNWFMRALNIQPNQQNADAEEIKAQPAEAIPESASESQQEKINENKGAVGNIDLNILDFQAKAVFPLAAVIPLRSKLKSYGPWASSNFSLTSIPDNGACGGTQIEKNVDLNPWSYGSMLALNNIAQNLVEFANVGLTRSEQGSVTTTSLPSSFTRLGMPIGVTGPNLTGINFSFGSGGISTNYDFRTFTPKFGKLNKLYVDKFKENVKRRSQQLRALRNQTIQQNRIGRKIRNTRIRQNLNRLKQASGRQASLTRVLIGEMYDYYEPKIEGTGPSQRVVVGAETMYKSINEMTYDFERKAFISMDGLYSPVTIGGDNIHPDSGILPRFITPSGLFSHVTSPIHPQPPFKVGVCADTTAPNPHDENNLEIHNMYLNPLANPNSIPHHDGNSQGHCVELVGRETDIPASGLCAAQHGRDGDNKYSDDYRFLGLRGPLVLHGWGYDTDGKPIPNMIDDEDDAKQGNFVTESSGTGLKDQFLPDWLQKPATWPVGPIDLRFDRERGVWVTPQPFKIVVAQLRTDVYPWNEGTAVIINMRSLKRYGKKLYDADGNEITETNECISSSSRGALRVITNLSLVPECGLVAETAYIRVSSIKAAENIIIYGTECSGSSSSSSYNCPSSSSSSPTETEAADSVALIKVVDRLGMDHYKDDMAYVYYDTYESAYVILQSNTLNW